MIIKQQRLIKRSMRKKKSIVMQVKLTKLNLIYQILMKILSLA